jgi:hypothetical protein
VFRQYKTPFRRKVAAQIVMNDSLHIGVYYPIFRLRVGGKKMGYPFGEISSHRQTLLSDESAEERRRLPVCITPCAEYLPL